MVNSTAWNKWNCLLGSNVIWQTTGQFSQLFVQINEKKQKYNPYVFSPSLLTYFQLSQTGYHARNMWIVCFVPLRAPNYKEMPSTHNCLRKHISLSTHGSSVSFSPHADTSSPLTINLPLWLYILPLIHLFSSCLFYIKDSDRKKPMLSYHPSSCHS